MKLAQENHIAMVSIFLFVATSTWNGDVRVAVADDASSALEMLASPKSAPQPAKLGAPEFKNKEIQFEYHGKISKKTALVWTQVAKARSYEVEVSPSAAFDTNTKKTKTKTNRLSLAPTNPGTYYFRVAAIGKDGVRGEQSTLARVDVFLAPPVNSGPETATVGAATVLRWQSVKRAPEYELQISLTSTFHESWNFHTRKQSGRFTPKQATTYYWRMRSLGKSGQPISYFSEVKSIQVEFPRGIATMRMPVYPPEEDDELTGISRIRQRTK